MSIDVKIQKLETKVYRYFHQDGLIDLMIAVLFLAWASGPLIEKMGLPRPWIQTPVLLLLPFLFFIGKKYITYPRLGYAKIEPARQSNKNKVRIMLVIFIPLSIFLAMLAMAYKTPETMKSFMGSYRGLTVEGLIYVLSLGAIGYYIAMPRLIIYGLILGINIPLSQYLFGNVLSLDGSLILWGIPGIIIFFIGLLNLVKLYKNFPKPASGELNNGLQ